MGMFSWDCLACGFSLRDCRNCSVDNWMNKGVVLTRGGSRVIGSYDSYGNLGGTSLVDQLDSFGVYHHACWVLVGKPEFTKPSPHAHDQGFCLPTHGAPLPAPTHIWLEKCPMAHVVDRLCHRYARWAADRRYKEGEALFATLAPEAKARCLVQYKAEEDASAAAYKAAMDAYYDSEDEQAVSPERPERPEVFTFEGVEYYASVLWVTIRRAEDDELRKNRAR